MDILFFGDFLFQKGLLSKEQLDLAVDYQLEHNKCVGQIALDENLLDVEQIDKIKEIQKLEDKKFGEVALEIGFLDEKQIDVILHKQKKRNIVFGDALLNLGFLSSDNIDKGIKEFKKAQKDKKSHIFTELAFCDQNQMLEISQEIFKSLFYRSFQEYIKFRKVDCFNNDKDKNIFISQHLSGDMDLEYILAFKKEGIPKFSKIDIKDEQNIIDVFCAFMNDYVSRIALELSNRDIIVKKYGICSDIEPTEHDFKEYYLLKFITADGDMSLYIKM